MKVKQLHIAICLAFSLSVASAAIAADSRIAVKQDEAKGEIRLTIDGKEALVYCYGDQVDLPHLYPIRSPNGKSMTVRQTSPYPHHRSFWFADKRGSDQSDSMGRSTPAWRGGRIRSRRTETMCVM